MLGGVPAVINGEEVLAWCVFSPSLIYLYATKRNTLTSYSRTLLQTTYKNKNRNYYKILGRLMRDIFYRERQYKQSVEDIEKIPVSDPETETKKRKSKQMPDKFLKVSLKPYYDSYESTRDYKHRCQSVRQIITSIMNDWIADTEDKIHHIDSFKFLPEQGPKKYIEVHFDDPEIENHYLSQGSNDDTEGVK